MSTWNVSEIVLQARYFNSADDRLALPCRSIEMIPAVFVDEQAADGAVMRSITKPAALLVTGVDAEALENLKWEPQEISFRDLATGEEKRFLMHGHLTYKEPDQTKFFLHHSITG